MLEALRLLVVGMGTVFSFLTLLVLVMQGSARVFARFEDPVIESAPKNTVAGADDAEIALAIAVAEQRLRSH